MLVGVKQGASRADISQSDPLTSQVCVLQEVDVEDVQGGLQVFPSALNVLKKIETV